MLPGQRRARSRAHVNVGNLLEVAGAAVGCYAVSSLWGVAVSLLVAGVLLVVAAELIYDSRVAAVPLPRRPHPLYKTRMLAGRAAAAVRTVPGRLTARRAL